MQPLSPEKQQELNAHLHAAARILYDHTEAEKLQTFESIELEVRTQILDNVSPRIGEFFFLKEDVTPPVNNEQ
jgi:hypothetical protein